MSPRGKGASAFTGELKSNSTEPGEDAQERRLAPLLRSKRHPEKAGALEIHFEIGLIEFPAQNLSPADSGAVTFGS